MIAEGPVRPMIIVFYSRTRKEMLQDDVLWVTSTKARQGQKEVVSSAHQMNMTGTANRMKKMFDKEIPIDRIPSQDWPLYQEAIKKEWQSWLDYMIESLKVEQEKKDRILPSRFVLRNKNAGLPCRSCGSGCHARGRSSGQPNHRTNIECDFLELGGVLPMVG